MRIRTWNLNRGNTSPAGMRSHLGEMLELIGAGGPDVVCLQELPAWALGRVGPALGMQERPQRTQAAHLGPLRLPSELGRVASAPHRGLLAPALAGCGNTILVPSSATIRGEKSITLNSAVFCEERGAALGLKRAAVRRWQQPRRAAHLVKYELPDRRRVLVATLQTTNNPADIRLADAELARALHFVERSAELEEAVVVAGDFNVGRAQSQAIAALESSPPEERWSLGELRSENVLLRGAVATATRVLSATGRGGRRLSARDPFEVEATPER